MHEYGFLQIAPFATKCTSCAPFYRFANLSREDACKHGGRDLGKLIHSKVSATKPSSVTEDIFWCLTL